MPQRGVEQIRAVSACYQQWDEGTIFNKGHFHFNFDMSCPWQVEVAFYGADQIGMIEPSSYIFGRDLLLEPFREPPLDRGARDVFVVGLPSWEVTIIHFRDFDSNLWYPYCFPTVLVRTFTDQTLAVVSKEREQEIWDLQMEAEWAAMGL